ncbi:unnamed protein product [Fusarium fujikuroi]|uniref:Uncharacterized protein n=1 Tax=Fusarium fujikuroi TaxID=5127 RepID=A0A9Q9RW92_FUSFU|nr:unnamed protein product [Fusarium fujikuroi]VTT79733.1 unnamed protein product [Fusarium fujikuroi]
MQRSNVSQIHPAGLFSLHPRAEGHVEQSPAELNGLDGISTPHNCLVAGCDHIFAIIIYQPNDESPWNFFVTEFYRVQGPAKLPYQISPTFLQVDYRSEYLNLLRYDIRMAVENYNTMVLGWWARLAARMGGRVFELRHVDAAVAQLKEQLLDPEMVAGWMNERHSPLGRGIFRGQDPWVLVPISRLFNNPPGVITPPLHNVDRQIYFVRTCREARNDLDRVARELLSLQTVLELIKDAIDEDKTFPNTLAYHVSNILANCHLVVTELQGCLTKYGSNRLKTKAGWAISGQGDVTKLRSNLEAHKAALELALDMLALHTAKAIKTDTTEIRNDTSAIKDGTAQILQEISQLQAQLSNRDNYILQKFLEDMTTYTENDLDGASIDWKSSSTWVPSPIMEDEESIGSAQLSISESAHFNVYNNHSEYQVAEEDGLSVWECIKNVETYYKGIEGEWRDICLRRRRRAAVMTEQQDIPDPFADEVSLESSTTHFTALTFPGREFAFQDILRPGRFQPPRQIKIAFYIPVDGFTSPNEFETQWNFISIHVAALAQQVASPWQNIVVIIEGPPRWIGVHPDVLMLFRKLGILFETDQSIDYVGRVSLYPPYHMERDEIFERPILGTIYECSQQLMPIEAVLRIF